MHQMPTQRGRGLGSLRTYWKLRSDRGLSEVYVSGYRDSIDGFEDVFLASGHFVGVQICNKHQL
jgi:hypothetical protein